jgi:acyl-CoA oxidase
LAWGKVLLKDGLKHQHSIFINANHHFVLMNSSPYGLHSLMFIPTLELQCSAVQKKYWLPLAKSGRIIGAYCQTELGHGTFLRGLETTATLDVQTDEWVVNSPTISSTKFWPGGIGYSATHSIVMAKAIIKGQDYGTHPFIMQFRSVDDHKSLPGIELGDIGLKFGYNETDNGYARFDHVRIPRENMLMGNAEVTKDGTYVKPRHPQSFYATMTFTRMNIAYVVAFQLAQAVTIAIRYSVVREQGMGQEEGGHHPEHAIMSYKSQHARLLALMSQAFAIHFASKSCAVVYEDTVARQSRGDATQLPYNHATTAGLKAYATQIAADGAEDARRCCGGHGYSMLSGLPSIASALLPMVTLEGENYVMYQQTARFLLKRAIDIRSGKPVNPELAYLVEGHSHPSPTPCLAPGADFLRPEVQLSIFRHRAVRLVFHAETLMQIAQHDQGLSYADAWNKHMMENIAAARAHMELFVLESFGSQIALLRDDPHTLSVLKSLLSLFALSTISSSLSQGASTFLEDGYIIFDQMESIRAHVNTLHEILLPNAIALTDSWGFSDASLQSALGMKDGNVYETLLSWARQGPLNVEARKTDGVFLKGWDAVLKARL